MTMTSTESLPTDQDHPDHKKHSAALLLQQVERGKELMIIRGLGAGLSPDQHRLSHWQSHRLMVTYPDLMDNPRYRPAVEFFLEDLYGPKDFSARDHGVARISPIMVRVLPAHVIHTAALIMELNVLSQELDHHLLQVLLNDLGVKEHIDALSYAEAYRRCNNYAQRKHQIELIKTIGEDIERIISREFIFTALQWTRIPSQLVGLGELHAFLERGFISFGQMQKADEFLNTITDRETQILDRIYAEHPNPFAITIPNYPSPHEQLK